jgi:hypothetical protein
MRPYFTRLPAYPTRAPREPISRRKRAYLSVKRALWGLGYMLVCVLCDMTCRRVYGRECVWCVMSVSERNSRKSQVIWAGFTQFLHKNTQLRVHNWSFRAVSTM